MLTGGWASARLSWVEFRSSERNWFILCWPGQSSPAKHYRDSSLSTVFLSIYAALAVLPAYMETFLLLVLPVILVAVLILLPFYSGTGEKSYRRRPFAVVIVMLALLTVGLLAYLGTFAPWSPHMEAWRHAPTPVAELKGRTPLQLQGAILIQSKQCRNCHALGAEGGLRGPALATVSTRLTGDQLIRQVIQGSGNMPAYGKNLRPAEVTALVAFMQTLRPSYQPIARDSSKH